MRPLQVPLEPLEAEAYGEPGADVVPLLLDRLGPYCSICERPLLEGGVAWDVETQTTVSPLQSRIVSQRLLVLCRTCDEAQAKWRSQLPGTPSLDLPFDEPTFTLDDRSLFEYGWQGKVSGPSGTIAFFGLRQPEEIDPRTRLRTRAWGGANHTATRLLADESGRESRVVPHLIAATGFLSMWLATILVAADDASRVRRFVSEARDQVPDFFPGTDWDRMLGGAMELA